MLIVLGCIVVCLLPKPTIQQECDKCFCPSSKPIPRESDNVNGEEGKDANLDPIEIKHLSEAKIERESKHLKRNVEEKMVGLGLNFQEENAVLSIFEHAYNKLSNNKISLPNTWKEVKNVLFPVRDKIAIHVLYTNLGSGCSFEDSIRCAFAIGDNILGCIFKTDNFSRMIRCALPNAYENQCNRSCLCKVTTFFLNKINAKRMGQSACPEIIPKDTI